MERSVDFLEQQIKEEKRKNELLRNVSLELGRLSPLEEKLNNILALLDTNFNLKHSIILFPEKNNTVLRVFASRGFKDAGIGIEVPFNYGVVGVVASKKKNLRVSRLSQYRRYAMAISPKDEAEKPKLPGLPNAESQVALPLLANNELVAVLSCESEDVHFFHQSDEDFLMTLSQQIALSIQNSIVYSQLDERVKLRTMELENLNKTKDKLFSIIGHDLRSPLTALEGIAELLEFYLASGKQSKLAELGPKISYAAKNVNLLLDNLLNWSLNQQEGIQYIPQPINLVDLVIEVHQIFKDFIDSKNIHFNHIINQDTFILADYNTTFSILRNIISNAIKFTPSNGNIEVSGLEIKDQIQITVKDTGIGISPEKIRTLFSLQDKKSTLGTARERGSGLGLVLVNEFIILNKGSIHIESTDNGTCISIILPKP